MAEFNAREYAYAELEAARKLMLEAAGGEFKLNPLLDQADDHILDVMDQLSHFCSSQARLYAPGEPQPVGSRLREAWRVLRG